MSGANPSTAKKVPPKWAPTVELPDAASSATSPAIICNVQGKTTATDNLDGFDLTQLLPARRFAGSPTRRNKPTQPVMERLDDQFKVESETESIFAHMFDRDRSVRLLLPQPFWIKRELVRTQESGQARVTSTWVCPDFLVEYDDGRLECVEVKRAGFEFTAKSLAKHEAIADACAAAGIDYFMREGLSDRERRFFYLIHLQRRTALLPTRNPDVVLQAILLAAQRGARLRDLWELGERHIMLPMVWWAIWHQHVCLEWDTRISSMTPIRVHDEACRNATGGGGWDFRCGPKSNDLLVRRAEHPTGDST